MITIKEMANMLGTSTTTVSNVIHGKTSEVSQSMVEKVQQLIEEYEYVPNINARNLAQDKSKIIAVAMKYRKDKYENFLKDPFTAELLGGIEEEVRAMGYFMMIYVSDDITEILKHVFTWNADGLILYGMVGDDCIRITKKYKKPQVYIDCHSDHKLVQYVNVGIDDRRAMYEITCYLLAGGHRRIAFLADNLSGVDEQRYQGYCMAMQAYGIETKEDDFFLIRPGKEELDGSLEEILCYRKKYTALACASDYYAALIMNYLQDHGVRVPEDISITGFDDNDIAKVVRPALTTVRQSAEKRGKKAVDVLGKMLAGETPEDHKVILPHEIVVRNSSK